MTDKLSSLQLRDHPDHPGWREWRVPGEKRFNRAVLGLVLTRMDDAEQARVRILPSETLLNADDVIHGGAILGLIDVAIFVGSALILEGRFEHGVTVDLSNQFLAPGDPEQPLDAVVEVVRETGRMVFVRGQVEQGENVIGSFSGILRKITRA